MKHKLQRILALIVLVGMVSAVFQLGGRISAADFNGISVKASVGYQGNVREGKWAPARLTLTNMTKADLKGEVVITIAGNYGGTTDYVVPAELPRGSDVELTIAIPGMNLNEKNNLIRFYKGSYKSGEKVNIVIGSPYLISSSIVNYSIGVLASDPDTLNFMPSLNVQGYNLSVIPLKEEQLPNSSILLDYFDLLVINDVATSGWDEQRVKAIEDWVKAGGTLMLSGGAGYSKTAQAFESIVPLKQEGTSSLTSPASLSKESGKEWKSAAPITVSTGSIIEGNTVLSENGIPLAITRPVGSGSVIYVAFDPSLEPIASWNGSELVYAKLLKDSLSPIMQGNMVLYSNSYWNVQNIVDKFPSINPPKFGLLLWMFVLYMLIAAPVLYFLLKKLDRREWTWWLVPTLAVLMGVAIFIFGAEDKRSFLAHSVSVVELAPEGGGVRSGAFGVFSPNGGTIKAHFDHAVPLRPLSNEGGGQLNLTGNTQVLMNDQETTMQWNSVAYWSTRKAWFDGISLDKDTGNFGLAYRSNNGVQQLEVTNGTKAAMSHVALIISGNLINVGDLAPNEAKSVSIPSAPNTNSTMYSPFSSSLFPYGNGRDDKYNRHRELMDMYWNSANPASQMLPRVVGFSEDHTPMFQVNNDAVRTDNLTMWVQQIGTLISENDGRVTVPAGAMQPVVTSHTMQRFDEYGDGNMNFSPGELEFEFHVPNEKAKYDKLSFSNLVNTSSLQWLIFNAASGDWIPAAAEMDAKMYIDSSNTIRMKMVAATDADARLPMIGLEGVSVR
ncbi:DUF7408 domain-containing protein [Paenibacillus radicis (ex Gao et al. 2016)]|uniref:DUF4350 domain-containing protein n=1 Tax=Paenibacillus radicis (ex Gao et al. 2016) TaxID=1737354 RepID=A0A917HIZ6_9BACL|nr:hypothetical protein [Paenibacillus radicis (ex Gao et al. 2016)]GGG80070.1 hypothetical protein GCM10010918_41490 [Paenibacillus radicis (ex Gao et al. 2016)]